MQRATPEQEKAARREPDGEAADALRKVNTSPAFVKTTEREIAQMARRGMARGFDGIVIGVRLNRRWPGNEKLIEKTLLAVWEFEERYGEPAKERYARRDRELGDL